MSMSQRERDKKVGAENSSKDEERAYRVKRLKEEKQERSKAELLRFLKSYYDEPYIGTGFRQRSSCTEIEVMFKTPKIVIEFLETDPNKREIVRREMFEAEHITDPDKIGFYWDRLKDWLGDTLRFGEIFDDEEGAE